MSVYCTADFYVLIEHADTARKIIEQEHAFADIEAVFAANNQLMEFTVDEYRQENTQTLEQLISNGIAFTLKHGSAADHPPGVSYARFTPEGNVIEKSFLDSDVNLTPDQAISLCYDYPSHARVLQAFRRRRNEFQIPPWDHQAEYGKRYLLKQLTHGEFA